MVIITDRAIIRNQRLVLIQRQGAIQQTCEGCPFNRSGNSTKCEESNCKKYKQLRAIGEQLLTLSASKKAQYRKALIAQAKVYGLTPSIYTALHDYEWNDEWIRTVLGMSKAHIVAWKKEHGFSQKQIQERICPACDGEGTVQTDVRELSKLCRHCNGTGEVRV